MSGCVHCIVEDSNGHGMKLSVILPFLRYMSSTSVGVNLIILLREWKKRKKVN